MSTDDNNKRNKGFPVHTYHDKMRISILARNATRKTLHAYAFSRLLSNRSDWSEEIIMIETVCKLQITNR